MILSAGLWREVNLELLVNDVFLHTSSVVFILLLMLLFSYVDVFKLKCPFSLKGQTGGVV